MENNSGNILISNEDLIYRFRDEEVFKINFKEIKLIAEYTTDQGPTLDDWFLVLYDEKENVYQVSMYAENIMEVLEEMREKLNSSLVTDLYSSADWKSNILWPEEVKGEPLWNMVDSKPSNLFERIGLLFGGRKFTLELTEKAQEIINK